MSKKIEIRPKYIFLLGFLALVGIYALYQARAIILGPQISITNIKDGETVESPVITLEGKVKNVAWITLNDRQIFTDENGVWQEKLIVATGTSIMTVRAKDRFGRETEESLRIVLN